MSTGFLSNKSVLVADSSQNMARLVTAMLRSLGRKDIVEVYDAASAMVQLNRQKFEVLILEDDLAGGDGVSFSRQLRSDSDCKNRFVPIIMMSAAPDSQRIADARDAGITEFLRKPFAANHLQTRLDGIKASPRPFVDTPTYAGPDRRRRLIGPKGPERRA